MILERVAMAIGSGPLTAAQVCNRVPCVESESRAVRILDYLVANGALECRLKGRTRFYCKPGAVKEPAPDFAPPKKKVVITEAQQAIIDRLRNRPWAAVADLIDSAAFRNRVERKRHTNVISGTLLKLWRRGIVERIGQQSAYRYAIKGQTT